MAQYENYTEVRTASWPIVNKHSGDILRLYNSITAEPFVTKYIADKKRADLELTNMRMVVNIPHIISLLSYTLYEDGTVLLYLPYYQEDMFTKIDDGLTAATYLQFITQITRAIMEIHRRNYYHGDIKLENILIHTNENICVCDLGAMRPCTIPYRFMGSIDYMSPESFDSHVSDHKATDIFSLGVLFFAMLYGKLPHVTLKTGSSFEQNFELELLRNELKLTRGFRKNKTLFDYLNINPSSATKIQILLNNMLQHDSTHRPNISTVLTLLETSCTKDF
jgi:serine/threonine protein kinase